MLTKEKLVRDCIFYGELRYATVTQMLKDKMQRRCPAIDMSSRRNFKHSWTFYRPIAVGLLTALMKVYRC